MNIKSGKEVIADSSKRGSNVVKGVASTLEEAEYVTKIDDLIYARGISQRDLAELSGLQLSYLSDFILGKNNTINKTHLLAFMSVLRVDSITDIINIKVPEKVKKEFEVDRTEWINSKQIPENVQKIAHLATSLRMAK